MPLPPAPTKPADRLPPKAFAASARSATRPPLKSEHVEAVKAPIARHAAEKIIAKEVAPKRATAALLDKSAREQVPLVEPVAMCRSERR